MPRTRRVALVLAALAATCVVPGATAAPRTPRFSDRITSPLSARAFAHPDSRYGVLAEWTWDECVTHPGIEHGLREFAAQHVTEVVVARWDGLVSGSAPEQTGCPAYLSDGFFAQLGTALRVARTLHLHLWLYDGDAAGDDTAAQQAALAGHPELQGELMTERVAGSDYEVSKTGMDKLNPAAARALIAVEYQQVVTRFAAHVKAGTLRGFWKDEPVWAGGPSQNGRASGSTLPWSSTLPGVFRREHGYALDDPAVLHSVLHGSAPLDRKRRLDFWSTVSARYSDAYFGVLQAWCHRYGLELLVQPRYDDADFRNEMNGEGSYFAVQQHVDVPGADLWSGSRADDGFRNATEGMNLFQVASAARMYGRTRAQQEPYGVTQGTGLELVQQKVLGDRMYARGLNAVSPAVTHYGFNSSQAIFAGDYGPMSTAWPYQHLLSDRFARLGQVLTGAEHVAPVAVLHPIESAWAMDPDVSTDTTGLQYAYLNAGGALQVSWRGVEVVSDELLRDRRTVVRDGVVHRPGVELRTVVLPAVTVLSPGALSTLERLVASGGSVVAVSRLPQWSTDGRDQQLQDRLHRLFGVDPTGPLPSGEVHDQRSAAAGHAVLVTHDYTTTNAFTDLAPLRPLLSAYARTTPADAVLSQPALAGGLPTNEIYHARQRGDDVYLVTNYPSNALQGVPLLFGSPSATPTHGTLSVPVSGAPELWDPDTGKVTPLPVWWRSGGRTVIPVDIPGSGSMLVVLRHGRPAPPHVVRTDVPVVSLTGHGDAVSLALAPPRAGTFHLTVTDGRHTRSVAVHLRPEPSRTLPGPFALHYESWPGLPVPSVTPSDDTQDYGDLARSHPSFSGTASYRTSLSSQGGSYVLDLGEVRDYAAVLVDGHLVGRRGWPPYRFPVRLAPGGHTVTVAVTDTTANVEPGADFDPAKPYGLFGPMTLRPASPATVTIALAR